jgi:hypothetical protein
VEKDHDKGLPEDADKKPPGVFIPFGGFFVFLKMQKSFSTLATPLEHVFN